MDFYRMHSAIVIQFKLQTRLENVDITICLIFTLRVLAFGLELRFDNVWCIYLLIITIEHNHEDSARRYSK